MSRAASIVVTLLSLVAIIAAPVLCLHALSPIGGPSCSQAMQHEMPGMPGMPAQPQQPPCCAAHPQTHSAMAIASFDLPQLAPARDVLASPAFAAVPVSGFPPLAASASSPPPNLIALRI